MQKIFKTQYEKLLIKYINNSNSNLNNIDKGQFKIMVFIIIKKLICFFIKNIRT